MTYHRQILHIYSFFLFSTSDSKQSTDIGLLLSARNPGGLVCSAELSWLRIQPASEGLGSCACLPSLCFGDGGPLPTSLNNHWGQGGQSSSLCQGPVRRRKALNRTVTANTLCQNLFSEHIWSSQLQISQISPFYRWEDRGPEKLNNSLRVMHSRLLLRVPVLKVFKTQQEKRKE